MYECKETAERQSWYAVGLADKDRRRVEGLSAVDELFALFCDVYLAYVDFQYVATILKKAQRTHEEGEKNGDYWNYLTATSGMQRELDKRTSPSMYVALAAQKPSFLGIAGVRECR